MPANQLAVEHLFTITVSTQQVAVLQDAPQGTRVHVRVTGGTFEGAKLRGIVEDGGGDWVTVRPDGSIKLDVRVTLKTDDGAYILATYSGVGTSSDEGL
ncbi:MAG: DUF3237 domain-containing protein, partial [Dehalococcoidia bacterium]|nr:DUF3237 domain-containing protein [Dehalococcoidia bacterium]